MYDPKINQPFNVQPFNVVERCLHFLIHNLSVFSAHSPASMQDINPIRRAGGHSRENTGQRRIQSILAVANNVGNSAHPSTDVGRTVVKLSQIGHFLSIL